MGHRVGIPKAVDSTGRVFGRMAIEKDPQPFEVPLRCGGCSTEVHSVRGYPQRDGTRVDPLYRLTHRVNAPHDPGCRYDFDTHAGQLHQEHRSVVTKTGDVYELRLPEIDPSLVDPTVEDGADGDGRDRLVVHPRHGHALVPVLSAAAAIAKLIAIYEGDPQARSCFAARWRGRRISWDDFYFDVAYDARRLARVVEEQDHPVAVSGVIRHTGRTKSDNADVIELDTVRGVSHPPNGRWIHVRVLSMSSGDLHHDVGHRVLGYGNWSSFTPDSSTSHFVRLWISSRWMVARLAP